jgi:predicted nucleic acid-binding protein
LWNIRGRSSAFSAYDTAYLDLAMRNICPVGTLDQKPLEAAKNSIYQFY